MLHIVSLIFVNNVSKEDSLGKASVLYIIVILIRHFSSHFILW